MQGMGSVRNTAGACGALTYWQILETRMAQMPVPVVAASCGAAKEEKLKTAFGDRRRREAILFRPWNEVFERESSKLITITSTRIHTSTQ